MKKIICLILMSFALIACGGDSLNIDYTSPETVEASMVKITEKMSDEDKKSFEEGMAVTLAEASLNAFKNNELDLATVANNPDSPELIKKQLDILEKATKGKSIKDIQAKAVDLEKVQTDIMQFVMEKAAQEEIIIEEAVQE